VGMLLLSIWSVLHWIDVVVHTCRAHVAYSYILVGCFFNVIRAFSDACVLWGTWRVLIRYEHLRPNMTETVTFCWATVIGCLLWFLALYHLCLQFALAFAWLSFADLNIINDIAEARNGFEIAFTAVQFVSTICTVLWAWNVVYRAGMIKPYNKDTFFSLLASIPLLIRSFCEVVIVGQLDRDPADIQDIARARDITYGLFSMFFVGFIAFATPQNSSEDPLVKTEYAAVEEVTTWIIQKLERATEHGRKTAPTMSALLQPLESILELQISNSGSCPPDAKIKRKEVNRLKALYADWQPIYKWEGEDADSGAGSSPSATQES